MNDVANTFRSLAARTPPVRSYVICTTPRTGSTLLCEALTRTGRLGFIDEWMEDKTPVWVPQYFPDLPPFGAPDFLPQLIRCMTTPSGIFGIKIMWSFLDRYLATPHGAALFGPDRRGSPSMPDIRYIHLVRRDRVRQIVSHLIAERSGAWHAQGKASSEATRRQRATVLQSLAEGAERQALLARADELIAEGTAGDTAWHGFFARHGIVPLLVEYEAMVQDMAGTVGRILGFLGQPAEPLPDYSVSNLQTLADSTSETIIQLVKQHRQQQG